MNSALDETTGLGTLGTDNVTFTLVNYIDTRVITYAEGLHIRRSFPSEGLSVFFAFNPLNVFPFLQPLPSVPGSNYIS